MKGSRLQVERMIKQYNENKMKNAIYTGYLRTRESDLEYAFVDDK
jgi:hypothetical protein